MDCAKRIEVLKEKRAKADADILLLESMSRPDARKIRDLKKWKLRWKDEITQLENPDRMTSPKSDKRKKRKIAEANQPILRADTIATIPKDSERGVDLAA